MGLNMVMEARVEHSGGTRIDEEMGKLQGEVDDLRKLVHTLLTIIMEEADGVQSGAAPTIPNQPRRGFVM
jgi:hypothetical protein